MTNEGVTTAYARSVSGSTATMVVTNAVSQATTVVSNLTIGRPTSVTDPLSRTTAYQYDSDSRLTRVTAPEGNYVQYSYDARGNVTERRGGRQIGLGPARHRHLGELRHELRRSRDLQPAEQQHRRARQRHRLHL